MWKAVLACVVAAAGAAAAQPDLPGGMCPMVNQGARITEVDTPDGAALDFAIDGDPMGLRARVHQMAEAFNQTPVGTVQAQAQAQDTSVGARLLITAEDPSQIGELRAQLRQKVADCTARKPS